MDNYCNWFVDTEKLWCDDTKTIIDLYDYVLIDELHIAENKRRCGFGRQLLRESITDIKNAHPELKIKLVACALEESINLDTLVDFYKSEGFGITECKKFAVVMEYQH